MKFNLRHWYDGLIYDKIIAPNQLKLYQLMKNFIPKGATLIDIACATGKLTFYLSDHCSNILGLDLSKANIQQANKNLKQFKFHNISFIHGNALELQNLVNQKFDVATITYAIHEMPHKIRLQILQNIIQAADTIIIADYKAPQSNNIFGKFNYIIEFFAGYSHFRNFLTFIKKGGIPFYLNELNIDNYKSITFNHHNTEIFIINNKKM